MAFTVHHQVLGAVFVIALVMGFVVNKTHFCTMGAVSDWINIGDTGRMRAWVLAMAVALLGVVTLEATGTFQNEMTAGRGFIALAAVIFGRWNPVGAMAGALVFAFFDAMQLRLSTLQTGIPSEFLQMAPYIATIIVVAGFIGRSRGPAAAGQPYETD